MNIKRSGYLVTWSQTVWNNNGIPKHSFITWLFVLDRCPTKSRILSWGIIADTNCLLCNHHLESRDHLFFDCSYSWSIWESTSNRCGIPPIRPWSQSFDSIHHMQGSQVKKKLIRIAWQASIYFLWQERNHRLHRQQFRPSTSIMSQIDATIRNRVSSLRSVNKSAASKLLQLWLSTSG